MSKVKNDFEKHKYHFRVEGNVFVNYPMTELDEKYLRQDWEGKQVTIDTVSTENTLLYEGYAKHYINRAERVEEALEIIEALEEVEVMLPDDQAAIDEINTFRYANLLDNVDKLYGFVVALRWKELQKKGK